MSTAAQNEHDTLFPSQNSSLAATDPELIAFFDDFAFDATLNDPAARSLDRHDRLVYQLGAIIAVGAITEFGVMLAAALDNGVTPVEAKEVVYQAVAYVGIARVIDFVHLTNDILTSRGVTLPLDGQSTTTPQTRREAGLEVQKQIVGSAVVDSMYVNSPADTAHFQRFLSANCFGDYYTRSGLDVRQRELLTFSMLAALGGADNQVKAHVTANLNVGNSRADLIGVLTVLLPFIGYPRTLNALAAVNTEAR